MDHFQALADHMEADPDLYSGSPGDVWGNSSVASRIALYRQIASQSSRDQPSTELTD